MHIKLISIYGWSIGTNAKAKYFAEKQNKEDIYFALREIVVDSYQNALVAQFSAHISCNDNPELTGIYDVSLYFNRKGDTFFEMERYQDEQIINLRKLLNKDSEKYRAIAQGLFKAIVATREFKQFAQKATKNIQDCFEDVIEPLYKGEFRVSDDELKLDGNKTLKEDDVREAIKNLMKLKGRIVSSSTLNLSRPEYDITKD